MRYGMPRKILVPADFTDVSTVALKEAAAMAEQCSAELIVVFADQWDRDEMDVYLRQKIDEVVPHNVSVEPVIVVDAPVDAILTVAKEKDVDWIVMGTHGRTGAARLLRGSITEEVVRHADRPVLSVHIA
ncbi:MAG TPA: universal stress protein [Thermoanaerobaculia bacterium]|nr:universal stress protein [Thermoanaerobaculia bacterium]